MGPTFIKLGQLLSTRADLLPPAYLESLARLQDDIDPFPVDVVRSTIEEELGVRLSRLPGRVNRAMDALASGKFELRVDAFDEPAVLQGLHRMANRVAVGLILAALIVGAALMSRVQTSTRIAGYPALAFVCFLAAALGGAWLVISIVVADRRIRRRR